MSVVRFSKVFECFNIHGRAISSYVKFDSKQIVLRLLKNGKVFVEIKQHLISIVSKASNSWSSIINCISADEIFKFRSL